MKALYGWIAIKQAKWVLMSPTEQSSAVVNAVVDFFLIAFLAAAIWVGATSDPNAFFFWVPFLGFVAYARVRQAARRWAP